MTEDVQKRSATIYQFPIGGRKATVSREQQKPVSQLHLPRVAVGGAWYHDAAIQDGKRAGDR